MFFQLIFLLYQFYGLNYSIRIAAIENLPYVNCNDQSNSIELRLVKESLEIYSPGSQIDCINDRNASELIKQYDIVFGGLLSNSSNNCLLLLPYSYFSKGNNEELKLFSDMLANNIILVIGCPMIAAVLIFFVETESNYHIFWRVILCCYFVKKVRFQHFFSKFLIGVTKTLILIMIFNILATNCTRYLDFDYDIEIDGINTDMEMKTLESSISSLAIIWGKPSSKTRFLDIFSLAYYTCLQTKTNYIGLEEAIHNHLYSNLFQEFVQTQLLKDYDYSKKLQISQYANFYYTFVALIIISILFSIVERKGYLVILSELEFKEQSNKEITDKFNLLWRDYSRAIKQSVNTYTANREKILFQEDPYKISKLSIITLRRLKNNQGIRKYYASKTSSLRRISSILDYKKKGKKARNTKNFKIPRRNFREESSRSKNFEKETIIQKKKVSLYSLILSNVQKDKMKKDILKKPFQLSPFKRFKAFFKRVKKSISMKSSLRNEINLSGTFIDMNSPGKFKGIQSPLKPEIKSPRKTRLKNIWNEEFVQSEPEHQMSDLEISPLKREDSLFNILNVERVSGAEKRLSAFASKSFQSEGNILIGRTEERLDPCKEKNAIELNQVSLSQSDLNSSKSKIQELIDEEEEDEIDHLIVDSLNSQRSLNRKISNNYILSFNVENLKRRHSYEEKEDSKT